MRGHYVPAPSSKSQLGRSASTERPGKEDVGVLADEIVFLELPFGPVPLVNPVDHPEESESSCSRTHNAAIAGSLHLGNQVLDEMDVFLFACVYSLAQTGGQGMVLMKDHGDFPVTSSKDKLNV